LGPRVSHDISFILRRISHARSKSVTQTSRGLDARIRPGERFNARIVRDSRTGALREQQTGQTGAGIHSSTYPCILVIRLERVDRGPKDVERGQLEWSEWSEWSGSGQTSSVLDSDDDSPGPPSRAPAARRAAEAGRGGGPSGD
jgi:hypothetical protein